MIRTAVLASFSVSALHGWMEAIHMLRIEITLSHTSLSNLLALGLSNLLALHGAISPNTFKSALFPKQCGNTRGSYGSS